MGSTHRASEAEASGNAAKSWAVAGTWPKGGVHQLVHQDGGDLELIGQKRRDKDLRDSVAGGVPALADAPCARSRGRLGWPANRDADTRRQRCLVTTVERAESVGQAEQPSLTSGESAGSVYTLPHNC